MNRLLRRLPSAEYLTVPSGPDFLQHHGLEEQWQEAPCPWGRPWAFQPLIPTAPPAAPRSLTVQQRRKSTFPWRPFSICLDGYYLNTFDYSILFLIPTDPALFKSKTLFLSRRKDVLDPGTRRETTTIIFLGNDQVNTNLSTLLRSCPNNLPNQWFLMCWLSSLSVPLQILICEHNEIPQLPTSLPNTCPYSAFHSDSTSPT